MTAPGALPARPTWYVGRAGISAALDRGAWLTTLVAGAGAGKTTALGAWAAEHEADWYTLGPDDAELSALLPRLIDAVRIPGLGDVVPAHLRTAQVGAGGSTEVSWADAVASLLAISVDQAAPEATPVATIILDGFDHLPPSSPAVRFVEALARHAPRGLRLVVSSRDSMPFAVDRLRETGRLAELAAEDLVFDVDETFQLLTIALGDAAAADEVAADLHTLTSGWPGQVSLGAAWLAQQPAAARRARLAAAHGFDAELSEALLAGATEPTRTLIRAAAYLPRVDARLMAELGLAVAPPGGAPTIRTTTTALASTAAAGPGGPDTSGTGATGSAAAGTSAGGPSLAAAGPAGFGMSGPAAADSVAGTSAGGPSSAADVPAGAAGTRAVATTDTSPGAGPTGVPRQTVAAGAAGGQADRSGVSGDDAADRAGVQSGVTGVADRGGAVGGGAGEPADTEALLGRAAPLLMPESGRPGWYRISSAARGAVLAKDPLGAEQRREILRRASRSYAERGDPHGAIVTGIDLGSPELLVELLEKHGVDLIATGRISDVIKAVDAIPAADRTPAVKLVEAEARHGQGDVAAALACLDGLDTGAPMPLAIARRVGRLRQMAGDIIGAADVYDRALPDPTRPVDAAIMAGQRATIHWLRSEIEPARTRCAEAIELSEACGDAGALAGAYATAAMIAERDGDFRGSDAYIARAAAAATAGGDLVQLIRIRINRSQRLLQHGDYAEALVELDDATRLIELTGAEGWFGAVARTNRGWAYRGLGRFDEALVAFDTARDMWRAAGSDLVAYAQIGLGATHLDRGDVDLADAELSAAIEIGERSGDHQAMTGLATLARARYATNPASAWQLVERSLATAPGHWRNWALLTVGWLALCEGDRETARDNAKATMANLERFSDPNAVAEAAELHALSLEDDTAAVRILADAQRRWAAIGNPVFVGRNAVALAYRSGVNIGAAEARLRALGVRPAAALAGGPLRVVGAFRDAPSAPDQARFVQAATEVAARFDADQDAVRARHALTELLALLPGAPAEEPLRDQYLNSVAALARACEQTGDVDAALAWHLRVLEDEPADERSHLGVVTTLARADRHAEARRRYLMYTERMRGQGREPAPYPQG